MSFKLLYGQLQSGIRLATVPSSRPSSCLEFSHCTYWHWCGRNIVGVRLDSKPYTCWVSWERLLILNLHLSRGNTNLSWNGYKEKPDKGICFSNFLEPTSCKSLQIIIFKEHLKVILLWIAKVVILQSSVHFPVNINSGGGVDASKEQLDILYAGEPHFEGLLMDSRNPWPPTHWSPFCDCRMRGMPAQRGPHVAAVA